MIKKLVLIALLFYGGCLSAYATDEVRDSVKIYFRQGKIDLNLDLNGNRSALGKIADSLRMNYSDSIYRLEKILVVGGASPEGSVKLNKWLSEKRAGVLFDYLSRYGALPDSLKTTEFLGRDWSGLVRLVENDPDVPYREETLSLLRAIADETQKGVPAKKDPLRRIQRLRGGVPYRYMYRKHFPELRASQLHLWYRKLRKLEKLEVPEPQIKAEVGIVPADAVTALDPIYPDMPCPRKPFYMDLRTNMLYDLLAVPNIGAEFYLGKGWSVAAGWMHGWWRATRRHWFWRAYGGDIAVRKWFGNAAKEKPLTGHHIGVYGQIFTYDFELGGRGYLGGKPGGTLWDKMNYAAGVEYGYSLPIARRLNIDFSIGVGYWGGTYYEYIPVDGHYVWQSTKERHWFGPTKAEVSLVWLIGHGNINKKKGGGR